MFATHKTSILLRMDRFYAPLTLLLFFAANILAGQTPQPRSHQNFDRDWKFAFGHAQNPEKDFNYGLETVLAKSGGAANTAIEPRFKDSLWRSLNLPHDWAVELPFVNDPAFNVMAHGYKPLGGNYPETSIVWYRKHFTVAKTEYEKDTIRGYVPDQDITAPWWASTAETWWTLAAENDCWLGGFVWTGLDYRGEPTPYIWPNINSHFGIMDVCGFPKNIYYYYQSWWTDKDILHISPHWNWLEKRGEPVEVWVNSNAEEVELFLNGKTLGKKPIPRNSHLKWTVNFEPGKLEAIGYKKGKGLKFKENGVEVDAIQSLKSHGFNYVRLRIFNDPAAEKGYSPKLGFCDLEHTKAMAKRVKAAGMKLLLDFHYSDYWADPGKQYKPKAWEGLGFEALKKALYDYTLEVMRQLSEQGTPPDMVQIGNEINHGIVWPEGSVAHLDSLAQLLCAGTAAVKAVAPETVMMLHVALGGQNDESVFFIENMLKRRVHFDVIGESYYPKWHGTLDDLRDNLNDLVRRFGKDVIVVEYSARKEEVHKIAFDLPGGHGKGACIWEPLSTWESVFDWQGNANELLKLYDGFRDEFLKK